MIGGTHGDAVEQERFDNRMEHVLRYKPNMYRVLACFIRVRVCGFKFILYSLVKSKKLIATVIPHGSWLI